VRDWSSDVCSSDLWFEPRIKRKHVLIIHKTAFRSRSVSQYGLMTHATTKLAKTSTMCALKHMNVTVAICTPYDFTIECTKREAVRVISTWPHRFYTRGQITGVNPGSSWSMHECRATNF
jgi:hypothetical protein